MLQISDSEFQGFVEYIRKQYGLDLSHKRFLIEYRLATMLMEKNVTNFSEYFAHAALEPGRKEITEIVNRLTTNHTFFMREENHFRYLQETVLCQLEKTLTEKDLRVWSAGCATGEEPYTIAMLLDTYFRDTRILWDTKVLATDISVKALDIAERAIYEAEEIQKLPAMWQMNYFTPVQNGKFMVSDSIRKEVIFRVFNLMDHTFPFKKKFHIIFCRNVMIYFDAETRAALIDKFYAHTEPGGYLFIGHSETVDRSRSAYRYVSPSVFRKDPDASP